MPTPNDIILIGILLLALVTVESGGYFLTRVVRGSAPANRLQMSFFRADDGHPAEPTAQPASCGFTARRWRRGWRN